MKKENMKIFKYEKGTILLAFLILFAFQAFNTYAQSRLVFNNNVYIVLNNSYNLVIDNNASNAITLLGTGGNIISEGEFNMVKWNIGTATGTYTIPFTKSPGNKIPFSINISTAGTGSGSILFSTYGCSWDNASDMPSDVVSMVSANSDNNSAFVIDRFWIVDAINYTTKPTASLNFTYLDSEWSMASNTISETNLGAQRFNSTSNSWWSYLPQGIVNSASNTLSSVPAASPDFFRSWTLVDNSSPLPIELLSFTAQCNSLNLHQGIAEVFLHWQTASETNNDYFVLEKSKDAINWIEIANIDGAGNSNSLLNYNYIDQLSTLVLSGVEGLNFELSTLVLSGVEGFNFELSTVFYRLKQVDFDGNFSYSDIIQVSCQDNLQDNLIEIISIYPNPAHNDFNYDIFSTQDREIIIFVINVLGKNIIREHKYIKEGFNQYSLNVSALAAGVYYFKIETVDGLNNDSKQILIK